METNPKNRSTDRQADGTFAPGNRVLGRGRPKMPREVREAFQEYTIDALMTLVKIMQDGNRDGDRLRAAEVILERGWGKPVERVDDERPGEITINLVIGKKKTGAEPDAEPVAEPVGDAACSLSSSIVPPSGP